MAYLECFLYVRHAERPHGSRRSFDGAGESWARTWTLTGSRAGSIDRMTDHFFTAWQHGGAGVPRGFLWTRFLEIGSLATGWSWLGAVPRVFRGA